MQLRHSVSVPLRPEARFLTPSHTTRRFQSPEGCRFGDRCNFAHGDEEIRSRPEGATAHRTLTCASPTAAVSDATADLRRLPRRRSVQQRRAAKPVCRPWQLGRRRRRARCSTGAPCDPCSGAARLALICARASLARSFPAATRIGPLRATAVAGLAEAVQGRKAAR